MKHRKGTDMQSKIDKRNDAILRQRFWDSLSTLDKLDIIRGRRGNSKKETERLERRLDKENVDAILAESN